MPKGDWRYLGKGSFNTAYRSQDGTSVLKIQHYASDATDMPERSVRLWNLINSHISPPARLAKTEYGSGWVCPFIEGVQASDSEMADALIDIFNKTGRIVVDATAKKNFVKTPDGQVLCVDVGMAVLLEQREDRCLAAERRKSIVSLDAWQNMEAGYDSFFKESSRHNPETVQVVKALLFIKNNRPDIFNVDFLKTNPSLVKKLAKAFDEQNIILALGALDRMTLSDDVSSDVFAVPEARVQRELNGFMDFLSTKNTSLVSDRDGLPDLALSAPFHNPRDRNKPYVNIKIKNPEITALFKNYIDIQEKLAEKQRDLINDYVGRMTILDNMMNDLTGFSKSEKMFVTKYCEELRSILEEAIQDVEPEKNQQFVEKKLADKLASMMSQSEKISRAEGLRGFINHLLVSRHFQPSFTMTNPRITDKVKQMKQQLSRMKQGEAEAPQQPSYTDNPFSPGSK